MTNEHLPLVISLTASDDGRSIDLQIGEQARLQLTENASTGYRWDPEGDLPAIVELRRLAPDSVPASPGSGAVVRFCVTAKAAGVCRLRFRHWRHWEGDASIAEHFRLRVTVRP